MSAASPATRRVRQALRPILVLAGVVALLAAAQVVRERVGLEWSAESIRDTVAGFGLWAPAGFVVLLMFRQLLALPSALVLTSAGLLFGAGLGTVLGGVGIALNASVLFGTARLMGRDWVLPRIHARWPDFETRARTAGPPFIALMTGHPMGVLTPFHFAAGVSGIPAPLFVAVVLPTAMLRAACYSLLGAYLLDPGSPGFWVATTLILAVALLPLAHPAVRARLLSRSRLAAAPPPEPTPAPVPVESADR